MKTVEDLLRFRAVDPDDERLLRRRSSLRFALGMLSQAEATAVVTRLFQPAASERLAADFQALHHATRAELLEIVLPRMEHMAAEALHGALTHPDHEWDRKLADRFAELVPDAATRRAVLGSLEGAFASRHASVPGNDVWVRLDASGFKNTGSISAGNQCPLCADDPELGADRADGTNGMELRGDVAGKLPPRTRFDFKRTVEMARWKKVGSDWVRIEYRPPGTNDDKHDNDEDLRNADGHIYSTDTPGPIINDPASSPFTPGDPAATAFRYAATFVEWVEVVDLDKGTRRRVSDEFEWHSVTTLRKVQGRWARDKSDTNEIEPGPIPILPP